MKILDPDSLNFINALQGEPMPDIFHSTPSTLQGSPWPFKMDMRLLTCVYSIAGYVPMPIFVVGEQVVDGDTTVLSLDHLRLADPVVWERVLGGPGIPSFDATAIADSDLARWIKITKEDHLKSTEAKVRQAASTLLASGHFHRGYRRASIEKLSFPLSYAMVALTRCPARVVQRYLMSDTTRV